MGPTEVPDAVLAIDAQNGSRRAFDQLVLRHKSQLYRIARHHVGSDDDALDVVQDAFVAAWLAIRRYDPARNFGAWLRTIALNKCRDFGRRQKVRRTFLRLFSLLDVRNVSEPSAEDIREREQVESDRLGALDAAITALPTAYKEVLVLTTFAGLSQQEAAHQLGLTPKAVEMKLHRAKQRLEDALKKLDS